MKRPPRAELASPPARQPGLSTCLDTNNGMPLFASIPLIKRAARATGAVLAPVRVRVNQCAPVRAIELCPWPLLASARRPRPPVLARRFYSVRARRR